MARSPRSRTPRPRRERTAPKSPRRAQGAGSAMPYWIAAAGVLVLILLLAAYAEWPRLMAFYDDLRRAPVPSHSHPTAGLGPAERERRENEAMLRDLQRKIDASQQAAAAKIAEGKAAAQAANQARALAENKRRAEATAATEALTEGRVVVPKASPSTSLAPTSKPARALPVDPSVLTTERIAAYQVALERLHFSCGFIDGDQGMRTQRMLRAYQSSRGLPRTGMLDAATRQSIGEPGEPFFNYVVTAADVASLMPKPGTWREKSRAPRLGYNEIWELLGEKFHCTRAYLRQLNPGVKQPVAGSEIIGPKVFPAAPYPHAASLRVNLGETSIEALDASGRIVAFFPCSIAADKNKRPNGQLTVKSVVPDPDYTFDPALFKDAAAREGLTHKMTLPPGPRNPVGTAWIGLSLPGYGIHGTPEPENISRTQSHGCFRLANWNAQKVLHLVHVGTPVDVEP